MNELIYKKTGEKCNVCPDKGCEWITMQWIWDIRRLIHENWTFMFWLTGIKSCRKSIRDKVEWDYLLNK